MAACSRRRSPTRSATRRHVATIAVGAISEADHANSIIAAGRADLCAIARPHLADPAWTLHEAARIGVDVVPWPKQYASAQARNTRPISRAPRQRRDMTRQALDGRHALVTGAGGGIGAAIARGARQARRAREPRGPARASRCGGRAAACRKGAALVVDGFDVTDAEAIARGLEQARAAFGPVAHSRQQCRRGAERAVRQDGSRAVVARARGRSDRRLSRHAGGAGGHLKACGAGAHHQRRLDRRARPATPMSPPIARPSTASSA